MNYKFRVPILSPRDDHQKTSVAAFSTKTAACFVFYILLRHVHIKKKIYVHHYEYVCKLLPVNTQVPPFKHHI